MREYGYDYDKAIVQALYKYGSVGRRQLKKIIESKEFLNRKISYDAFYYHIKRMLIGEYIYEKRTNGNVVRHHHYHLLPQSMKRLNLIA